MTSKDELTGLFTTYFGDKLAPAQIEALAAGVIAAQADRRAETARIHVRARSTTPTKPE
jgi:hypothetical protein